MLNKRFIIAWILCCVTLASCVNVFSLADLQPDNYSYPSDTDKAAMLIRQMGIAHNIAQWDSIETYQVTYKDDFYGFFGKQAHPFKEQDMTFSLSYVPGTFDGQLEIKSGKQSGDLWGYQNGKTYRKTKAGTVEEKKNKDMQFWIPTYQYFIEFPSRIQEATSIDYIGEKVINGVRTEGVIASWNTVKPQKNIDQYLIWLDAESHRIVKIEYTVRDAYKFVAGGAYFESYKDYDGIILPSTMPVESNLVKDGLLHKMSIESFTADPVRKAELRPLD